MASSNEKLVKKSLAGDNSAFEELLGKHLSPVFNFLFQLTRNRDEAEDLAQETFVKAWKNLKRFDQSRNFRTWLFTIAKNTAFDWFRKKKEIPLSNFINEEGESALEEIKDKEILPDEILERKASTKMLEEKLKKIPEYYRAILLLHYKEGFTLAEIAEMLGEPYSTVKSRHLRALKRLKQVFLQ